MAEKRALITGVTGQDGSYLAKFLLDKGYEVFGTYRRLSTPNLWRLQYLDIVDKIHLIPMDLDDSSSILHSIHLSKPDEFYHLAAQSFVDISFAIPESTGNYTGLATTRILEVIRTFNPQCRFYFASSSEMYGNVGTCTPMLNENSKFAPRSPYAISKLYGYWTTRMYRDAYNMFACNGILFNHESPLRGLEFVTRKISNEVAKIHLGISKKLVLGNLNASRDWGYAPEYVQIMWKILQQDEPKDYVVATGKSCKVLDFARLAFKVVDLDYRDYVETNPMLCRPAEVNVLCGDSTLAAKELGWKSKINFEQLVSVMVEEDVQRWKRWSAGEKFPWDAYNYPSELKILSRI